MKVRYTEPAAEELEAIILYFRNIAPAIVADFADSIDAAVLRLADNPHLAQETEKKVSDAGTSGASGILFSMRSMTTSL